MKKQFEKFLKSSWGLELWLACPPKSRSRRDVGGGNLIFRSKKSGVKGLLDFILESERGMKACLHSERVKQENGGSHINEQGKQHEGIVIFDKIVGRGAALLVSYLKAKEVYGGTGSKLAAKVLEKYRIKFYFQKTVPNILNRNKTDLCPMEKLSIDKTPEKFYDCLSNN